MQGVFLPRDLSKAAEDSPPWEPLGAVYLLMMQGVGAPKNPLDPLGRYTSRFRRCGGLKKIHWTPWTPPTPGVLPAPATAYDQRAHRCLARDPAPHGAYHPHAHREVARQAHSGAPRKFHACHRELPGCPSIPRIYAMDTFINNIIIYLR